MSVLTMLTVRKAEAKDVDRIVEIVQWAFRGGKPSEKQWTGEEGMVEGPRITAEKLKEMMTAKNGAVLVCETQSEQGQREIIGCVNVEHESTEASSMNAHFGMLAVDPAQQSGGIGRRLMEAAENYARQVFKCQVMVAEVVSGRPELMSWYLRLGYRETGRTAPFLGPEHGVRPLVDGLHFQLIEKPLV